MPLEIITVPCLSDNYAFLIGSPGTGETAVVDVPDAGAVEEALSGRGWKPTHVFVTHHHSDHIGGVEILRSAHGAKVVGSAEDAARLPKLDLAVKDGESFDFAGHNVAVMDVPGHTVGHIAFHIPSAKAVFTGDSLMALGCGRVFEGTMEQMWASLSKLAALPDDTIVCSGHEYTAENARFALTIEPENPALVARAEAVAAARAKGEPTVPSILGEEKATNPFLRAARPEVKKLLGMPGETDAAAFAEIRARKNRF